MLQIMRSYKNKNMVSRIFVSTLCKRRQDEAEAAINSAVQRLQVALYFSIYIFKNMKRLLAHSFNERRFFVFFNSGGTFFILALTGF